MADNEYDWPIFKRVGRRERRTELMMRRLGIDPLVLARLDNGEAVVRVQRTCFECKNGEACRRWLEENEQPIAQPEFCPNLEILRSCQRAAFWEEV